MINNIDINISGIVVDVFLKKLGFIGNISQAIRVFSDHTHLTNHKSYTGKIQKQSGLVEHYNC